MMKQKIIRITTVPQSLGLFKGQPRFMSEYYTIIGVSSPGNDLNSYAKDEGIRVIAVNMTRTISPIKDLKALYQLYKIFKSEKPLIIHTHTPKAGTLGMIAGYLAGVKNRLHTVAGMPLLVTNGNKRRLLEFVEKITYSCATHIYPNSHGLSEIIIKNGYAKSNKIKVIGNGSTNGIVTSYFDPLVISDIQKQQLRNELGIQSGDFVYLFLGRLVKDKGINELVSAFKIVNKRNPNTKLLLLGSYENELDPLLTETEKEIRENPNILELGFKLDVRPYFSISNVLTFPSYREGFPNVVMQAGAMEVPCIVTNINGCNEIIIEGVNGTIIPVKDAEALQDKMIYMLENTNYIENLKKNSREMIISRYEQKTVWNAILEEYVKLEKNV